MRENNVSMAKFMKFCNTCEKQAELDLQKKIKERERYDKLRELARRGRM